MATSVGVELMLAEAPLPGNFKLSALGATRLEVNIKKINNKKMMSVIEDILNSAFTLDLFLIPMFKLLTVNYLTLNYQPLIVDR